VAESPLSAAAEYGGPHRGPLPSLSILSEDGAAAWSWCHVNPSLAAAASAPSPSPADSLTRLCHRAGLRLSRSDIGHKQPLKQLIGWTAQSPPADVRPALGPASGTESADTPE
jgi:hypothetical protein